MESIVLIVGIPMIIDSRFDGIEGCLSEIATFGVASLLYMFEIYMVTVTTVTRPFEFTP